MNRTNQILATLLALQIVLIAVAFWPRGASVASGASLFPEVEADQIVGLTISDAAGKQIQLVRTAGNWVLPEADDYPTQEDKVSELLDKIVALKANRLVTQTPASHKRLKVAEDDYQRRIDFELNDGATYQLYLGTSPSFGAIHVRAGGQDEVYLARDLSASEAGVQATAWVDPVYFSVPQAQIAALTVENANGQFAFEKDEAGTWTMKGLAADETLNESSVTSLVNRISSIRMQRPLGKTEQDEYGLKEPSAVVTVQTRDGDENTRTQTLRVGAKRDEDNSYVVSLSESPYYVRVAGATVQDFVEKTRDDFLQLPATPTPGS